MDEKKQLARMMAMEYFKQNNLFKKEDSFNAIEEIVKEFMIKESEFCDALEKNKFLIKRTTSTK